jgi:predicted alpha/beta superfamily hydrolase
MGTSITLRIVTSGLLCLAIGASSITAAGHSVPCTRHEEHEVVRFEFEYRPATANRGVFLVGSLPELAGGDVRRAIEMATHDRVHWFVSVRLPARGAYTYRFVERTTRRGQRANRDNATRISEILVGRPEGAGYRPPPKRMRVRTSIVDPLLCWRVGANEFECVPLHRIGAGRTDREGLFEASFGVSGLTVAYFLVARAGGERAPPVGEFETPLDTFFHQDGEVFTYVPARTVTPAHRVQPSIHRIQSAILGRRRDYRVMVPRGYSEHSARRYPVLYMYDGQFVWDNAGNTWDPGGDQMALLVGQGFVGEMIVVAIDSPTGCARVRDTTPPEDTLVCGSPGNSFDFLAFLATELKPHIDASYRTRPNPEDTFLSGFSLGGLLAITGGQELGHVFGGVAAQSPAVWTAPNYMARSASYPPTDERFYLDVGLKEAAVLPDDLIAFSLGLTRREKVFTADHAMWLGFNHTHTYTNAGRRMKTMLTFLHPAGREPVSLD